MGNYSMIKKMFAFLLFLVFFITWVIPCFPANAITLNQPLILNPVDSLTLENIGQKSLPQISVEARAKGILPASLKNVTLKLKPKVNWLTESQVKAIKEHADGGRINSSFLPSVEPGKIYVDPSSLTALEFVKGEKGVLYILQADDEKIVEEISIPEQTVFLNEANITGLTSGINVTSYKMKSGTTERAGFNFYFDERQTLPGYDQEGKRIEVALKGSLNVDSPAVEVKYTKDNGYKFVFFASQKTEVQAELLAQLKKDIKIPLYDFTIPAEGCRITVGFFLVLGVDGRITMEYSVKQSSSIRAGLQGGTSYYMPTSFDTIKEVNFSFTPENLSLTADVKGETSILAEVAFDILGKGKIVIDNKIGVFLEAKTNVQGSTGNYLSIKGDGFVKISGKVKVKSFDKSKTIYEYKYPIFNYIKERLGNYNIDIAEACAYSDLIKGRIVEKATGNPYSNKEIQLKITNAAGIEKLLSALTDKAGYFTASYDLKKGDLVRVKLPGTTNTWSFPREASFPFNCLVVETADYLANAVKGYVNSSDQNALTYNGPVILYIERSNNIPLHPEENIFLPVEYNVKFTVQSSNGVFQLNNVDIRPFDKVYAVLEKEGFNVYSDKIEAEGITVSVDGNYSQEPYLLSSANSVVIIGNSSTASPFSGEIDFKVTAIYPHSTYPENTLKSKEWRLNPTYNSEKKHSVAATGPWQIELNTLLNQITSPLDKFRSSLMGGRSVNYHVFETVSFFVEGKKLEYFDEAKTCEEERRSNFLSNIIEKNIPLIGSAPANYYLKTLSAVVLNLEGQKSSQNQGILSPKNFTSNITVKYYPSASSSTPSYSKGIKFYSLNEQQKVEMGVNDPVLLWDKNSKTKVIEYKEFPVKENVRYDLDDYIPELKNIPFALKGTEQVNGISCQVWEKSKKIDPVMNVYVKLQLFIDPKNNLPVKVVFLDGYYQKIELLFTNWQRANVSGSGLFSPPFGEIRLPMFQLELPPSINEGTEQSGVSGQDLNSTNNNQDNTETEEKNVIIYLSIGNAFMTVNGNSMEIDPGRGTVPLIMGGRTILPIRAVVEAIGGSIKWNDADRKITIIKQNTTIEMWIDKKEMLVNGLTVTNDVPPVIIGARTYVPVRFVGENLNCNVGWDQATQTVTISTK
ncbi:stalk domain-containing protein [Thermovenabulum sp.]|uniref:stalk domain-containing protein n=1 Tax=Thermovenabulum sp. TaxID=3100335 RepID=UPI003C7DD146